MPEEMNALRQQILRLLEQQMEALDSPLGLTDERLSECYARQARVQALRDKLQALAEAATEVPMRSAAPAMPVSLDTAA